jgi:hypothetical protein
VHGPSSCLQDLALDLASLWRRSNPAKASTRSGREGKDIKERHLLVTTLETGLPQSDVRLEKVHYATIAAGILPVVTAKPEEDADPDVRGYRKRFGVQPSYWAALGRDAGVLAKRAISPLPLDSASKEDTIFQRRAIVEAGLVAARIPLWSSEQTGVSQARRVERLLTVRKLGAVQ